MDEKFEISDYFPMLIIQLLSSMWVRICKITQIWDKVTEQVDRLNLFDCGVIQDKYGTERNKRWK